MIQHRNHIGRDVEVGWMRLCENSQIFLVEPDELDVRLGRLHLCVVYNRQLNLHLANNEHTYPTMR